MRTTLTITKWLIRYKGTDNFVAIDQASGGYSYPVSVWNADSFPSQSRAQEYIGTAKDMEVSRVIFDATFPS